MTATFGKLENQTLTLQPGLNVIHAPNEWGKSTWCAFLLNMLYGIDTRERTTQTSLADKDRYAPWSGAAMSGRIELNWKGRDITIERSSNSRIPMGIFRAYETETGIDIPELTGSNCGQQLLGVERSVFTRAGFLRLADLPVTQDDALRRRLNNLVTTGDESGSGDMLGQTLKDLKNKCRSNKANGLLPEAEDQKEQLREQLRTLQDLHQQTQQIEMRQAELEQQLHALENHRAALEYQASLDNAEKVAQAQAAAVEARETAEKLTQAAQAFPSRQEAQTGLAQAQALQDSMNALHAEERMLPDAPVSPPVPARYQGLTPEDAVQQARDDAQAAASLEAQRKASRTSLTTAAAISLILALSAFAVWRLLKAQPVVALLAGCVLGFAAIVLFILKGSRQKKFTGSIQALAARYPGIEDWVADAQAYFDAQSAYALQMESHGQKSADLGRRKANLDAQLQAFTDGQSLAQRREALTLALRSWDAAQQAQKDAQLAQQHAEALAAMANPVEPPKDEDTLHYSPQMTTELLANARFEQRQLQLRLGQCQGQMETLGSPTAIQAKLDATTQRIARLETYYNAIEMAQDALYKATIALQRRFSPRITKRAQTLFSRLTGDRYRRITMSDDMSLSTAAEDEVTLQELRRRSDGTIDQMYLALRLAVAEELTPESPLVLDDALVRFDETRLASAMEVLKETAECKQVILFTCQHREEAHS